MPVLALLPFFTTLLGGLAALRLRHRLHPFMAFASGVLVATAVVDLLPEAHDLARPAFLEVGVAALAGYLAFTLVEAFIHQSSFEHQDPRAGARDAAASRQTRVVLVLPAVSLIAHSTLDGLAIGLGFQASEPLGMMVLLAVLAHDFADGLNVTTLALDAASGTRLAIGLLLLDAAAPLVGAGLSLVIEIGPATLGMLLAWFAGVFLAIGAGHLMPEAQHHRGTASPMLVVLSAVGAGMVVLIRAVA